MQLQPRQLKGMGMEEGTIDTGLQWGQRETETQEEPWEFPEPDFTPPEAHSAGEFGDDVAEEAVLAGCICSPGYLADAASRLHALQFVGLWRQEIWNAMAALLLEGQPVNAQTMHGRVAPRTYHRLLACVERAPNWYLVDYVGIVADYAKARAGTARADEAWQAQTALPLGVRRGRA